MQTEIETTLYHKVSTPDETELTYVRLGDGPPLVICHGSFATASDWRGFAEDMASSHTVYLYDRRGRGLSPYVAPDFAIDAEVDDLATIVDLAGPGAAILGHSFGGGCALSYAARARSTGPLIVYEPRHSMVHPVSRGFAPDVDQLVQAGDMERAMECVLAKVVGMPPDAAAEVRGSPLWPHMVETVGPFAKEVRFLDSLSWQPGSLDSISGPVTLLVGEQTMNIPDEAAMNEALISILPGVRKVVIPGEGHFAVMSAPGLFATIVRDALAASS